MGTDNVVFLENLEWFDETGKELVHRLPEKGSGEIKWGAQLTVRESQAGVFFYKGKAVEAFGPGMLYPAPDVRKMPLPIPRFVDTPFVKVPLEASAP